MPEEIQTTDKVTELTEIETPQTQVEETTETPSEEVENLDAAIDEALKEVSTEQPSPEQPDYKEKFVHSQRESILNAERIRVKEAQLEQLTKTDTPTDEAMRQVYPEWDDLNEVTKKALIKTEAQEMRQRRVEVELSELREEKRLKAELDNVIESEPKLLGKESAFKKFAANPKNKGISAEVLAKAFLFDVEEIPAPVPRTEVLPQGNGGSREPLKPKKISIEEAAEIRKTDNNRYMQLVKSGMIDDEI